jgi:hypothetical protein
MKNCVEASSDKKLVRPINKQAKHGGMSLSFQLHRRPTLGKKKHYPKKITKAEKGWVCGSSGSVSV